MWNHVRRFMTLNLPHYAPPHPQLHLLLPLRSFANYHNGKSASAQCRQECQVLGAMYDQWCVHTPTYQFRLPARIWLWVNSAYIYIICIYSVAESSLIPVGIFLLTRKDKIGIAELYKPVKIKLRYLTSTRSQWADLTDLETLRFQVQQLDLQTLNICRRMW